MNGRTVILVSHHVQLCAPQAKYIVALDNGRVIFHGSYAEFARSGAESKLLQSDAEGRKSDEQTPSKVEGVEAILEGRGDATDPSSSVGSTTESGQTAKDADVDDAKSSQVTKKPPRKLIEEEKRAVGRIGRDIWENYTSGCGGWDYWPWFVLILILASLNPVLLNGWVR